MSDLSDPWGAYARLQTELMRKNLVDHRSWGLEAGLNGLLKSASGSQPPTQEEIDRTVASGCRRERHRAHLRLLYFPSSDETAQSETASHSRYELLSIRVQLGDHDWALLRAVAEGQQYKELSTKLGVTPGNLRARVLRLRRRIRARVAA